MALTIKAEDLRKLLAEIDNDADIVIMDDGTVRELADVRLESVRRLDKSGSISRVLPVHRLVFDLDKPKHKNIRQEPTDYEGIG